MMSKNLDDVISQIQKNIDWLDKNAASKNMVKICQVIDRLAVLSVSVGHHVAEAYAIMNELDDDYDVSFSKRFVEVSQQKSAAATKPTVEAELADKRRAFTQAKNAYKRLDIYLDRLDKVIESYRQLVSVVKQSEMKHI
jgi:hypothetical protein